MAPRRIRVEVKEADKVLKRFQNQLGALGEKKARVALARAVNHSGRKTYTAVKRALKKQTSAPSAAVEAAVKAKAAAHQGDTAIEFVIYGKGSELPLNLFKARQFSFGVRAKVWGKMRRFPHTFINRGFPGSGNPITASERVFVRTGGLNSRSGRNNAFEEVFGPSIPKEMLLDETRRTFEEKSRANLEERIAHEIGRLLPS